MSFFYKNLSPRNVSTGSIELKEKIYQEVVKDGVTYAHLKVIDPSKDIELPKFEDYSLEKRLAAGVDVMPVSLNVSDEVNPVDDDVKDAILSDSSVADSSDDKTLNDVISDAVSSDDDSSDDSLA